MISAAPHYLLLAESQTKNSGSQCGKWRFVLEQVNGSERIEVEDTEPEVRGERLQLLSVVRGLEALEQPSRVTLVTSSHYVGRGIRTNLAVWREKDFVWERFGELVPVKNRDLWRRIDRAMGFHELECRVWHFGSTFMPVETVAAEKIAATNGVPNRAGQRIKLYEKTKQSWDHWSQQMAQRLESLGFRKAYGCA